LTKWYSIDIWSVYSSHSPTIIIFIILDHYRLEKIILWIAKALISFFYNLAVDVFPVRQAV